MRKLTDVTLLFFATWRIANMLADTDEQGPYGILDWIRYYAGVRYDAYSNPVPSGELSKMLLCIWCNSAWIGLAFTILYAINKTAFRYIATPFAASGGAVALELGLANQATPEL